MNDLWVVPAFAAVAFIYSSAGLGGGSAYLAILALSGISFNELPQVSLSCNIAVAGLSFFWHVREGYWRKGLSLPFILTSIPFSFIGGQLQVGETFFRVLLSGSLFMAALFFLYRNRPFAAERRFSERELWTWGPAAGAALGLLSGIVGIGGGIFLIPLLLVCGLASTKEASAAGSFFILVNSLAGLAGRAGVHSFPVDTIWPLWLAVLIGGWLGGRSGAVHFSPVAVQRIFAAVITWASFKIAIGG